MEVNLDAQEKINRAYRLAEIGQYERAERIIQETAEECSSDIRWIYLTGILAEQKGDLEVAREHYEQVIALNPLISEPYRALAKLAIKDGALEKAGDYLSIAVEHEPEKAVNHFMVAYLAVKYDALPTWGEEALTRAEKLGYDPAALAYVKAVMRMKKGDEEGGKRIVYAALEEAPEDPNLQYLASLFEYAYDGDAGVLEGLVFQNPNYRPGTILLVQKYENRLVSNRWWIVVLLLASGFVGAQNLTIALAGVFVGLICAGLVLRWNLANARNIIGDFAHQDYMREHRNVNIGFGLAILGAMLPMLYPLMPQAWIALGVAAAIFTLLGYLIMEVSMLRNYDSEERDLMLTKQLREYRNYRFALIGGGVIAGVNKLAETFPGQAFHTVLVAVAASLFLSSLIVLVKGFQERVRTTKVFASFFMFLFFTYLSAIFGALAFIQV